VTAARSAADLVGNMVATMVAFTAPERLVMA
jgi:hypothetical protein